jgi:hypothetical protein
MSTKITLYSGTVEGIRWMTQNLLELVKDKGCIFAPAQ